jgi:hypothetical protein
MTLPTTDSDSIDYVSLRQADVEDPFPPESFLAIKTKIKSLERYEEKQGEKNVPEQNILSVSLQNTLSSSLVKSKVGKFPAEPAVGYFDSINFTSRYPEKEHYIGYGAGKFFLFCSAVVSWFQFFIIIDQFKDPSLSDPKIKPSGDDLCPLYVANLVCQILTFVCVGSANVNKINHCINTKSLLPIFGLISVLLLLVTDCVHEKCYSGKDQITENMCKIMSLLSLKILFILITFVLQVVDFVLLVSN